MGEKKKFFVGLLYFNEIFGSELTERLNKIGQLKTKSGEFVDVEAEHILIHEMPIEIISKYHMVLDRGSHILKYAIGMLMTYAFRGVHIVNNPLSFHYFIANKDVGFSIVHDLGINVPKTYVLPPKTTPMFTDDDFRYHKQFDWQGMISEIGWPCYIKPADGRGAMYVQKVDNMDDLLKYYNLSGIKIMTLQKCVSSPFDWHVRCLCIGRKILPMKYRFREHDRSEYVLDENFLKPEQNQTIIDAAKVINRAFGYEMNSVEFILDEEGKPWAIDFNNPIPDARKHILGDKFYNDYMDAMIQLICEAVTCGSPHNSFLPDLNQYSEIARMNISREEKFKSALKIAEQYYDLKEL